MLIKSKDKLSKKQVMKTYANIISLVKMTQKTEFTTPVETNKGLPLYITIKVSDIKPKDFVSIDEEVKLQDSKTKEVFTFETQKKAQEFTDTYEQPDLLIPYEVEE